MKIRIDIEILKSTNDLPITLYYIIKMIKYTPNIFYGWCHHSQKPQSLKDLSFSRIFTSFG